MVEIAHYGCRMGFNLDVPVADAPPTELVYVGIDITTLDFTTMVTPIITANTNAKHASAIVAAL